MAKTTMSSVRIASKPTDVEFQKYRKTALVEAAQLDIPFEVETLEGTMKGNPGDYLACGIEAELWPIKREIFEATYEPIVEQGSAEKEVGDNGRS